MFAVIRLRGSVKTSKEINDTLEMLRIKKVNHCVVIPKTSQYEGMLRKVKDYVTYGDIDKKTLVELLKKRGRIEKNQKLDEVKLKEITNFDSFEKFADALMKGSVKLKDYKKIKPFFRLNPPRKGLKAIRLQYPKGDLGYRKEKINELLERMM